MNNADLPAYPAQGAIEFKFKSPSPLTGEELERTGRFYALGLTKRERFAMGNWTEQEIVRMANKIENDINTGSNFNDYVHAEEPGIMAKARVALADALLKELDS